MPSRDATRAALIRSREPAALPAPGADALPVLPPGFTWQQPPGPAGYDRLRWSIVLEGVGSATTVARVEPAPGGCGVELGLYRPRPHRVRRVDLAAGVQLAGAWAVRHADAIVFEVFNGKPPPALFPYRVLSG